MAFSERDYRLRAVWLSTSEPVSWIAERCADFVDRVGERLEISEWHDSFSNTPWPGTADGREQVVSENVRRDDDQVARPRSGYDVNLSGLGESVYAHVQVTAGNAGLGRQLPRHTLDVRLAWRAGNAPSGAEIDPLIPITIDVWNPVVVSFTSLELIYPSWRIQEGWRVWLRSDVGSVTTLAEGLTAVDLEGGTLLCAPDEWPAAAVKAAIRQTLVANGLDEIPRES